DEARNYRSCEPALRRGCHAVFEAARRSRGACQAARDPASGTTRSLPAGDWRSYRRCGPVGEIGVRGRILVAVLAIAAAAGTIGFSIVRGELQRQRGAIAEAWSRVESAIQRRADAIPGMLETLRPEEYDSKLFEAARAKLAAAEGAGEKIRANRELSLAVARLLLA